MPVQISDEFHRRIAGVFGDAGLGWLARLPEIVAECAEQWGLVVEPPFALSYNYVAPARRADGTPVVLKVRCPHEEASAEMEALRAFAGDGICAVLAQDEERNASLLERVLPGMPLAALVAEDDERATAVAIDLMQRLWRPPPVGHRFPTVADWAAGLARHRERFDGGTGPLPARLFEEAEDAFAWLLATTAEALLLHGDLHHANILSATRQPWLIIDPKGIVGDPGYDLGAFLYNPMPGLLDLPNPGQIITRRVDQLAEGLGMERARVRGWGIAQAVLSACWSIEGDEDWRHTIAVAEYLAALAE
ncbi:MAG TPA: aminoglycoside phosphotransferase family protein [Thermomicrobiales bacterium]|nr:aminoglycoside phosphotransferase family protein [Thermomicrobiales bacterium]